MSIRLDGSLSKLTVHALQTALRAILICFDYQMKAINCLTILKRSSSNKTSLNNKEQQIHKSS